MLKVGMKTIDTGGEAVIIGDGPGRIQLELIKVWEYDDIQSFNQLPKELREGIPKAEKPMSRNAHAVFSLQQKSIIKEDQDVTATEPVLVKLLLKSIMTLFGASGNWASRKEYYDINNCVDINMSKLSNSQKIAVGFDCDREIAVDRASVRNSKIASGVCKYSTYTDCEEALNK